MRRAEFGPNFWRNRGWKGYCGFFFNVLLCCVGLLFLSGGTYASVKSIIQGYETDTFGGAFTCASNGI